VLCVPGSWPYGLTVPRGVHSVGCVRTGDDDHRDGELLALYDELMRGAAPQPPPGVTYEQDGPLVRAVGGFQGFVFGLRDIPLRGDALDELIERQRDRFAARGERVEWRLHSHDGPPELRERLRAAGFAADEEKTVLVGESTELAAEPVLPQGIRLRRVTGADDMRRIAAMEAAVWGVDLGWLADLLIERTEAAPDDVHVLVAEHGREIVCAAWMFLWQGRDFAGLRGGTTLPAWRGRGVYRALVAERARIAAARGVPYMHVDATDESLPILRRLGFRAVTTLTPYVWTPGLR
jgi:GNAT superfamily N-acetyltransferase